ncbi:nucleoporin like [Fagus crenata]
MATTKSVDASLWWDPFSLLLTDLESAPLSPDLPPNLAKKLKENRNWFVDTVSRFKSPNEKSKEALNSEVVKIGAHQLTIQSELKEKTLRISSYLCLDEVQSYIIVERSLKDNNLGADSIVQEYLHVYTLELTPKDGQIIREEALKLISDGLERKSISVLEDLLSSSHPEQMDVDLFTLWAEETLIEDNLVLDILFLAYYESFCTCNGERWKKLCSLYKGMLSGACNFGKLAISSEALHSSYHAKIQLLRILIETLDLEILLQMVHDEMPFRNGFSVFTLTDVQEMDAIISSFNAFELKEAGPLILAWAVFLCLISSLPGKEENDVLMEIDHVGYVRQAFGAASLYYFLEIVQSDILKESDGPVAGYRSVLRTFVSAFIASYEINLQMGDSNLNLILDILCKIYRGVTLCPVLGQGKFYRRSYSVSSLQLRGYNFLDKSVGISSLFEINSDSLVDNISQIVETHLPVHVPGVEGLFIPSKTRAHVLKVIGGNTALVRWEYTQSGVLVLLLRLAQDLYPDKSEEVFLTLDLLCRMVSFNTDVCFAFMEIGSLLHLPETGMTVTMEKNVWAVEIICTLVRNLSPNSSSAALMSMGVKILGKVLEVMKKCIMSVSYFERLGDIIRDLLLCDSSIHNALFRIICTTKQSLENLYSSRLFELMEIEGLQLSIGAVLDILFIMLSNFSKDVSSSLSVFHQAVLSCTTKPVPVAAAVTSLISYFRNPNVDCAVNCFGLDLDMFTFNMSSPAAWILALCMYCAIQVGAARIADLRHSINHILLEQSVWNEDLFVATVNLLTSAVHYQTFNNASVPASAQATFPYKFAVSKFLQPGTFDLVGTIIYEIDQSPYQNTFYNGTIEVLEAGGPLSIESVFLVTLASALLVLLVIWIRGQIQNLSKKTKRAPKVEVGTKTTDASLDEWLQGTAYTQSLSSKSKKKK